MRGEVPAAVLASWTPEQREAHRIQQTLETPLAESGLPVRIVNILEQRGVLMVKDLLELSVETLLETTNFGEKTLKEVRAVVKKLGLPDPWKKNRRRKKT